MLLSDVIVGCTTTYVAVGVQTDYDVSYYARLFVLCFYLLLKGSKMYGIFLHLRYSSGSDHLGLDI